jgi:hypothetical protein
MAAFDYTTPTNVFAWGSSAGTATDPVNEATEMARIVTGMSRAIDTYCNQTFYQQAYSQQVLPAQIDADGILTCYPAVPTLSTPTAADWRFARSSSWTALELTRLDLEIDTFGCVVRALDTNYLAFRGSSLQMRLSYTGGWANLAAVPSDFSLAMDALCWWAYQKRNAPTDQTAIPELGVLVIPGSWPPYVKSMFKNYIRQVVM